MASINVVTAVQSGSISQNQQFDWINTLPHSCSITQTPSTWFTPAGPVPAAANGVNGVLTVTCTGANGTTYDWNSGCCQVGSGHVRIGPGK